MCQQQPVSSHPLASVTRPAALCCGTSQNSLTLFSKTHTDSRSLMARRVASIRARAGPAAGPLSAAAALPGPGRPVHSRGPPHTRRRLELIGDLPRPEGSEKVSGESRKGSGELQWEVKERQGVAPPPAGGDRLGTGRDNPWTVRQGKGTVLDTSSGGNTQGKGSVVSREGSGNTQREGTVLATNSSGNTQGKGNVLPPAGRPAWCVGIGGEPGGGAWYGSGVAGSTPPSYPPPPP